MITRSPYKPFKLFKPFTRSSYGAPRLEPPGMSSGDCVCIARVRFLLAVRISSVRAGYL